ncbi:MAG: hypothetical protein KC535_05045 [Nanoarchaeota archaeon]|nr:hypothetical protein [Nanoarchaeota archaeon]
MKLLVDVEMNQILILDESSPESISIAVPSTSLIDKNGYQIVLKARVKVKGKIWTFHKYDKDPFPSSPHGHNFNDGTKLNPFDGKIYKNKEFFGTLDKHALLKVQQELQERGFGNFSVSNN